MSSIFSSNSEALLQNYYKILKTCFLVTSSIASNSRRINLMEVRHKVPVSKGLRRKSLRHVFLVRSYSRDNIRVFIKQNLLISCFDISTLTTLRTISQNYINKMITDIAEPRRVN